MGAQREPVWPDGFVGSLTHTDGFCAAAVARRERFLAVGIDAEPDVPLEPNIAERVSSESEIALAAVYVGNDPGRAAHLVFSAKEAFYKCQFPLSRTFLGFEDVRLDVEGDELSGVLLKEAGSFAAGTVFRGRWQRRGSLFLTAFWLVAD
jgi:4'-phosphopantetheinyl transferase EntD